jgi:hypothetical protein
MSTRAVEKLIGRFVAAFGLDPAVTVHSLPATALTTARERGSDISDLQDFAGHADSGSLHTSYALQAGYEPLIWAAGRVTAHDVEMMKERLTLAGDTRDILAARDSMLQLLGCDPLTA